jgi:hypothetical protein
MQRVAVVNEFSASDVPDISQLVTVDVESISGSARRDSRDSATGSDSERNQQSNKPLPVDDAVTISGRDSHYVSDPSDNQNHEQLEDDDGSTSGSNDDLEANGSNFVSIESIVAPASHVDSLFQHAGTDSGDGDVVLDAQEAESNDNSADGDGDVVLDAQEADSNDNSADGDGDVVLDAQRAESNDDSADEDSHDLAEEIDHDRSQDIAIETQPEDTEENESSSDVEGEHPAEYEDDSIGSHRLCLSAFTNPCYLCFFVISRALFLL